MKIKWIKIDGLMTAIDKDTGEIINETLDILPNGYDVTDSVMEVLTDLFGEPLNTTAEIKSETRGRKAKGVANPYASYFANVQYDENTGKSNMNSTLDDLVYSASTVSSGNTRIPVKQLVYVMRSEDLSTKGVQGTLGKRRVIKGESSPKERYCRDVLSAAEHLIKRVDIYESMGRINLNDGYGFSFKTDSEDYGRSQGLVYALLCPIDFTEGDKATLRSLALKGDVATMERCINSISEQATRMIQRIQGRQISNDSKLAYAELNAEFPYQPYDEDDGHAMHSNASIVRIAALPDKLHLQNWADQIRKHVE